MSVSSLVHFKKFLKMINGQSQPHPNHILPHSPRDLEGTLGAHCGLVFPVKVFTMFLLSSDHACTSVIAPEPLVTTLLFPSPGFQSSFVVWARVTLAFAPFSNKPSFPHHWALHTWFPLFAHAVLSYPTSLAPPHSTHLLPEWYPLTRCQLKADFQLLFLSHVPLLVTVLELCSFLSCSCFGLGDPLWRLLDDHLPPLLL